MSTSVALISKVTSEPRPASRSSARSSSASCTEAERPITVSARQFAFLNQTNLPPPKNGSVCKASIADRIRETAWSTLSAQASITSTPNSPASGGANLAASSAATRFTSLSSDPTIAWIFDSAVFAFTLGTGDGNSSRHPYLAKKFRNLSSRSRGIVPRRR